MFACLNIQFISQTLYIALNGLTHLCRESRETGGILLDSTPFKPNSAEKSLKQQYAGGISEQRHVKLYEAEQ